jgi:hypothetical protein
MRLGIFVNTAKLYRNIYIELVPRKFFLKKWTILINVVHAVYVLAAPTSAMTVDFCFAIVVVFVKVISCARTATPLSLDVCVNVVIGQQQLVATVGFLGVHRPAVLIRV